MTWKNSFYQEQLLDEIDSEQFHFKVYPKAVEQNPFSQKPSSRNYAETRNTKCHRMSMEEATTKGEGKGTSLQRQTKIYNQYCVFSQRQNRKMPVNAQADDRTHAEADNPKECIAPTTCNTSLSGVIENTQKHMHKHLHRCVRKCMLQTLLTPDRLVQHLTLYSIEE